MAQNEYASAAGPYVEAMRTVRGVKNLFFGLLALALLFLLAAFCLVRYAGVLGGPSQTAWENYLAWAFPFATFIGVVVGCLYVLTLLIGLKISLAGRLEGAAGLTQGFFWSLLFLAIFLPWQHVLVHESQGQQIPMLQSLPGVLYGLDELKQAAMPKTEAAEDTQKGKVEDKEPATETESASVSVPKEARLAIRFILYPIAALLILVAAQSKYRPQRVEMPEPVSVSRLTEKTSEE